MYRVKATPISSQRANTAYPETHKQYMASPAQEICHLARPTLPSIFKAVEITSNVMLRQHEDHRLF